MNLRAKARTTYFYGRAAMVVLSDFAGFDGMDSVDSNGRLGTAWTTGRGINPPDGNV